MKFKEKLTRNKRCAFLILSIISIILFFQYFPNIEIEIDHRQDLISHHEETLKTSVDYLISPIFIDDTDPSNNWETFALLHDDDDWFTNGTGSVDNPYVIHDVVITGAINCIVIQNSRANFTIIYSELNSAYPGSGVLLYNVSFGLIEYNEIYNGFAGGIRLMECENNIITGNIIDSNEESAVSLQDSSNNLIFNNTMRFNDLGIAVSDSLNNIISENIIKKNRYSGISLSNSNNTQIERNTVYNHGMISWDGNIENGEGIILRYGSSNNSITENSLSNNKFCGIKLSYGSGNTKVAKNVLRNNSLCGIMLLETVNNNISNNILDGSGIIFDGIWVKMESNNISSTNLINNKPIYYFQNKVNLKSNDFNNAGQALLLNCENSSLLALNVSQGSIGLTLIHCRNISISSSYSFNNVLYGIYLSNCHNITIEGITANSNGECGIFLETSNNIKIRNVEANYNNLLASYWFSTVNFIYRIGSGIFLRSTHSNQILRSAFEYNEAYGIYLSNSDSIISENEISYNEINGIVLESSGGLLSKNIVRYNGHHGIYLSYCIFVEVLDNDINHQQGSGNNLDYVGIFIDHGWNNDIKDNIIESNEMGIYISLSNGNNVSKNHLDDNGIYVNGNSNTISENIISNSISGLDLSNSDNNIISENTFNSIYYVIELISSDHNNISGNIINGGGGIGMEFIFSSYNTITGNKIYGCYYCFREDSSCISNIFEDNVCVESQGEPPNYLIYVVVGFIAAGAVVTIIFIKKRLGR